MKSSQRRWSRENKANQLEKLLRIGYRARIESIEIHIDADFFVGRRYALESWKARCRGETSQTGAAG